MQDRAEILVFVDDEMREARDQQIAGGWAVA